MPEKPIYCYFSGPIERDPASSFHAKNNMREFLENLGIKVIGDTFEHLKALGCPQEIYGPKMKKLRNQGKFHEYNQQEKLVTMSFRKVKKSDFMIVRPSPEASGGTTSEIARSWFSGIPKLVIVGAYGENLLDNDSTFVVRMLSDRFSLIFKTEKEVIDFIKKHLQTFKQGRRALQQLILDMKRANPYINDLPKPLYNERFEGKTVIILGMAGAGKSTQARLLQNLAGFKYFGSGQELRKLADKYSSLKETLSKGHLADECLIKYKHADFLFPLENFEPAILDGSPRKIREAENLMELLDILKRKPEVVVIDIGADLAKNRLVLRRNCDSCKISFCDSELVKNPVCPECGNPLSIRMENTTEEDINAVINQYETDIKTVIKFFEDKGLVTRIDGNKSKKEIFQDIISVLKQASA